MTHLHSYVMSKQVLYLGISDTPAWVVVKANECELNKGAIPHPKQHSETFFVMVTSLNRTADL
jgi:hypothetical protein